MASWSNATVTEKGYALQAKLLSTDALVITRVVSGSGRVTAGQLINQTAVREEKQTLSVEALSYDDNGNAIIKTSLNNKNLSSGYSCNQIGIYASDPDEGEILYAIAQESTTGEDIPSIEEQPHGYYCSWVFTLTFSNSSNISVTIDPANALTKEAADEAYADKNHSHNFAGKKVDGETFIISDTSFVAGDDAEIFNYSGNIAIGDYSHAEGYGTVSLGDAAHSEGLVTSSQGVGAHSEGCQTYAFGYGAHASGIGTYAVGRQFATGKYNKELLGPSYDDEQSADSSVFIIGYGTSSSRANAFRVSSGGKCYGASAFVGSGADFPEFEEWADGNPDNEDRRGLFVALNGDKIMLASSEKDHIIGVVSVMGAFIANGASENWHGMYLKDVFGENLTQPVEVPEETRERIVIETDEDGNKVKKIKTEVIPAHTVTQFVVNPDYNPDEEYIGREFRKEWAPVGKLGQVIVVDDGTCTVGGYCKPSVNGIGTAGEYGYYVRKRIDSTHIKVEISPGAFNK